MVNEYGIIFSILPIELTASLRGCIIIKSAARLRRAFAVFTLPSATTKFSVFSSLKNARESTVAMPEVTPGKKPTIEPASVPSNEER